MPEDKNNRPDGWESAVLSYENWLSGGDQADAPNSLPEKEIRSQERRRCQHLFWGAIRQHRRIQAYIDEVVPRPPGRRIGSLLAIALFDLLDTARTRPERCPKVVHHAVDRGRHLASPKESGLVNAVLRRALREDWPLAPEPGDPNAWGLYFSHPDAWVDRWLQTFGPEPTRDLLRWNQQPADTYLRLEAGTEPPSGAEPTDWAGFFRLVKGAVDWSAVETLLSAGHAYIQDPGTRLAVDQLAPPSGAACLDLCGAPGGKGRLMHDRLGPNGSVLSVDRVPAGAERERAWADNQAAVGGPPRFQRLNADIGPDLPDRLVAAGHARSWSHVLIDVPCSNSGVFRRRPEARYRDPATTLETLLPLQARLLVSAAAAVAPGGVLVYSTCSLEPEENERQVERFLASEIGRAFRLTGQVLARPWETGHDGAGASRLERVG
ncbi:MAG: RsmB/NOP family class I SAM-dependent RNA methyltransferase [Opitutales bacterium]